MAKRGRPRKIKEVPIEDTLLMHECCKEEMTEKTEKEKLSEVYEFLKSRGIHSIGDIENLIAKS